MKLEKVKTILTKVKYGKEWYGITYNMNLYRGCSHGCIYCDSRSDCYHIDSFDMVRGKEKALDILKQELSQKKVRGVVGIGAMSDSYNPFERQFEYTRGALQLFYQYHYGVCIDTKSDLILRDLDLLTSMNEQSDVIIKFTITTTNDELSKIIEPNVCVSSLRFQAMKVLSENGLFVGVMMSPVLPYLTDTEKNIREMVRLSYQSGAKFIITNMGVTLRDNQRNYYYRMLDYKFPGLKEKYICTYGKKYYCTVPNGRRLYQILVEECEHYGLLYRMKDIIEAYQKKDEIEQLTLF